MAKDDFHVIAYRILQYLYECLKAGQDPETNLISAEKYEINERYFETIIGQLFENGYIIGVIPIPMAKVNYTPYKITSSISITMQGIEYLTDNSFIAKARKFFRMTKETVPFI